MCVNMSIQTVPTSRYGGTPAHNEIENIKPADLVLPTVNLLKAMVEGIIIRSEEVVEVIPCNVWLPLHHSHDTRPSPSILMMKLLTETESFLGIDGVMGEKVESLFCLCRLYGTEHAKAFAMHDSVKIAGVTGRSPDKVNNFAQQFETYAYPSISAMYDAKADIVVTAVNEASSLDVSLECLNQPWACLFEKPKLSKIC